MSRILSVNTLEEFESNGGEKYGIYWVNFNNAHKLVIRNGSSFGVVSHFYGEPAAKCVSEIRDDVRDELIEAINNIN